MPPSIDRSPSFPPHPAPVPLRPLDGQKPPIAHLPQPLTSFIGREREVATVVNLLRREHVRLVTLTGPGGVGKTRLAIRVAEIAVTDFLDGVWFVPLATVRDPALIASTIARALGIQETADRSFEEGIGAFFAGRREMLVLDNYEHVLDAAPLVTELLAACPALTVLVTSRSTLRLSGEHDISVPPLASLDPERLPPLDRLREAEAIRLFVERATSANAEFVLTEANATDVATLCARLDGLPLAIELAASRNRALPPQTMLRRLDQRLRLLTGGARDQPMRLRSLREAIAWSYDLLTEPEQVLFRRLAVFVGGCTLAAAEAVASGPDDVALDPFEGIASLVDKSLLRPETGHDGESRYLMLETVREYGLEQLAAHDDELGDTASPRRVLPGSGGTGGAGPPRRADARGMALGARGRAPQPPVRAGLAGRAGRDGVVPATRVLPRAVLVPSQSPERGTEVGGAGAGTGRRGAGRPAR